MSEQNGNGADGGSVRVSLKEMFQEIKTQITDLGRRIDKRDEAYELRLGKLEHDFPGFEARMKLHEQQPGHAETSTKLAALEATVAKLNTEAAVGEAIAVYIEKANQRSGEMHRWLIGLSIGNGVAVLLALLRLFWEGHP